MRLLQAARLSRLGDASTGIEKQDEAARSYADAYGHTIIGVAPDTDVSGGTDPFGRPELGPWLTDPEKIVKYDGIVASNIDRLARSTINFMKLLQWADDNGKKIIALGGSEAIDFSSPTGKLIGYVISWLGEQELAAITDRNAKTRAYLQREGYLVGRPPFGFMVVEKDKHKTLAVDPKLAPVLRTMIDRYLDGDSYAKIARWLDSEGIAPATPEFNNKPVDHWWPRAVRGVLRNPILIGRRVSSDGRTVLKIDPLIDIETWTRLQNEIRRRGRNRAPVTGAYLLTGVLFCSKCGGPMYRMTSTSRRKLSDDVIVSYYRCHGTEGQPSTCKNMIPQDKIETWLDDQIRESVVGTMPILARVITPGSGHEDEIENLKLSGKIQASPSLAC